MAKERKAQEDMGDGVLVRILGKDIRGSLKVFVGLTKIQGISWAFSNALCKVLGINPNKKIQDLTVEEIAKIENFAKNSDLPAFLKNRQKDFEDGLDKHVLGSDLRLRKEFDVKRLRKIKSYKGIRHGLNLPVRGQRTKSHFRHNRKKSGGITGVKK